LSRLTHQNLSLGTSYMIHVLSFDLNKDHKILW
jgi:hypothetical protein